VNRFRKRVQFCLSAFVFLTAPTIGTKAQQQEEPLKLSQTIPMPNVKGRIDHMDVDVKGQRLFVAGLENGSLEVVDLRAGKWVLSIPGFKETQGVAYEPALNKLFALSGADGMVRVFRADTLAPLESIQLDLDPDRLVFDPTTKLLYVGCGGKATGMDHGVIAIVDATNDGHLGNIQVADHPAELLMDKLGETLFAFVSIAGKIQVIDVRKRRVLSTWSVSSQRPADAAFDESTHRLFVGTRTPPTLTVIDSNSGKELARLPTVEGMDGVYFDAVRKRIYISGGRGFDAGYAYVYQQRDADHYSLIGKIVTRPGAGTSFWSPELNRYYVAAPANAKEEAAILVFEPL
jgi:DNA-binding beta-propeller fold protein YncE